MSHRDEHYETWEDEPLPYPQGRTTILLNPVLQASSFRVNCEEFLWEEVQSLTMDEFDSWYKAEWIFMRCALAIRLISDTLVYSTLTVGVLCAGCEDHV